MQVELGWHCCPAWHCRHGHLPTKQLLTSPFLGLPSLQVALAPPEVQIDLQQQQEYEKQLQEAANMPLPDGDDDDIAE